MPLVNRKTITAYSRQRDAKPEEIRKAYRTWRASTIPTSIPATKARKRVQANLRGLRSLSDEKKRKIFDQYGFYADNLPPGGYGLAKVRPALPIPSTWSGFFRLRFFPHGRSRR